MLVASHNSSSTMLCQRQDLNAVLRHIRGLRTPPITKSQAEVIRQQARDRIARIDADHSISPFLIDSFSRPHDYLRISLTERCNLRCFYCMPSEGVDLSPESNILTDDEVIRLATLFVRNGVRKIRLTGGEPTVRRNIVDIVGRLKVLRELGLHSIGMTSNGIALHRKLPSLVENGLTHLNVSLDTLDPFKFEIMTRRRGHEAVMRSIEAALSMPELRSVKLNVVVVRGLNDGEVLDFLDLTKDRKICVRFIEFMPFTGNKWDKTKMIPSSELLSRISSRHPTVIKVLDALNDTARNYRVAGYKGSFGFISSMSDHFCGSCNRLRLTADGQIKVCLFDAKEISLRDQIRHGASDDELLRIISFAVRGKKEKHAGMGDIDVVTNRPMILIGGTNALRRHNGSKHAVSGLKIYRPSVPSRDAFAGLRSFSVASIARSKLESGPLTHIDGSGRPAMVNVSAKDVTKRSATAVGKIYIPKKAYDLVASPIEPSNSLGGEARETATQKAENKARSKGDVFTVAQLAAIMGSKRTSELIPLCHPLPLSHISVNLRLARSQHMTDSHDFDEGPTYHKHIFNAPHQLPYWITCEATVSCEGKTGVEMEALTAVSIGLLTVWDMLKAVAGGEMIIGDVVVRKKEGGQSGDFVRELL